MDKRLKLLYGARDINPDTLTEMVMINREEPQICIYKRKNKVVLAIYGQLLCGAKPSECVRVNLTNKADLFSMEIDVINYIRNGIMDPRLTQQLEYFSNVKVFNRHGDTLKRLVKEIKKKATSGSKEINVNCEIPEITLALKNYVAKTFAPRKMMESRKSLNILI